MATTAKMATTAILLIAGETNCNQSDQISSWCHTRLTLSCHVNGTLALQAFSERSLLDHNSVFKLQFHFYWDEMLFTSLHILRWRHLQHFRGLVRIRERNSLFNPMESFDHVELCTKNSTTKRSVCRSNKIAAIWFENVRNRDVMATQYWN